MSEIESVCYTSFERYQEKNSFMKADLPEYQLVLKMENGFLDYVCGLFG